MTDPQSTELAPILWKLLATTVFVLLNGFFVAAEFALVKVRPGRLETLAKKGNRRAALMAKMLKRMDLYLSACQLGITLASLILGWLAEPAVAALLLRGAAAVGWEITHQTWLHPTSLAIALTTITLLHMTVGEQAPKVWSIHRAESMSLTVALPLWLFTMVFKPMIWVVNVLSNALLRAGGLRGADEHQESYDVAELRAILNAAATAGHLTPRQKMFGENILGLVKLEVRHVMVPRVDVDFLSSRNTLEDNLQIVRETGHSRFPLGDPDLDNVKGLIHSRDLLAALMDGATPDLMAAVRACPTVTDTQPLSRFILDLQKSQTQCAMVVDEHGTTVGVAYLEDALEEIVGPIHDEFDQKASPVLWESDDAVELAGRVALPEAAGILDVTFDEDVDTIGGYVAAKLGRLPEENDLLAVGPYEATVEGIDHTALLDAQQPLHERERSGAGSLGSVMYLPAPVVKKRRSRLASGSRPASTSGWSTAANVAWVSSSLVQRCQSAESWVGGG